MLKLRESVNIVPLAPKHAEKMARWMHDPTVSGNVGLRSEPSLERTMQWIEGAIENSIYAFAIEVEGNHVGNVVFDKLDDYLQSTRFSIYIGEQTTRNSGVGRTATYKICKFGFENLSLHKIWLTVHAKNFPAINTYTQIGFELEGILRDEFWLDNQRLNVFYMGLLKSDFERLPISYI